MFVLGDWSNATGVVGDIHREKYDLSPASWTRTLIRDEGLDFTVNMFDRKIIVMLNHIDSPADWTLFLRPFELVSWGGIFLSFLMKKELVP